MDTQAWRSAHGLRTTKTTYVDENTTLVHTVESDYRGNTIKEYTNGILKRTSHYYTNGTLRSTTDALDNTTKYSYNGLGKVVKTLVPFTKDASGNMVYSVTENTYDKNGNVTLVKQTVNEQSASAAYSYTANTYDAQGRLIQVHQYGDADNAEILAKYFYNADGVLIEMQTGASSADYLSTTYTYDAWNRLVTTNENTGYCSGSMTYDRNGNVLTSTDANGYVTTNTYDALNRVVSSETETGNSSKDVSKSTYYNNMGQVSRTVCNGQTTWYTYDLMGRLIQESGTQFTGYYYVGSSESLARTVTGKSNLLMYSTISYTYDSEMRLATVSTNGDLTATYAYDATAMRQSLYGYSDPNELVDNTLFGATTGGVFGTATWGMSNSSNISAWFKSQITPGSILSTSPSAPAAVSVSNIPRPAPDFVVTPNGEAIIIPSGASGPVDVVNPSGKITGFAYTGGHGGLNGQVASVRIMDPTLPKGNIPGYPSGYVKYENAMHQGVDLITGRTLPNSQSHIPLQ